MVSKAAERSSRVRPVTCCLSMALMRSSCSAKSVVSVAGPLAGPQESRSGVPSGSWDPPQLEPTAAQDRPRPRNARLGWGPQVNEAILGQSPVVSLGLGPLGAPGVLTFGALITRRPGHRTGP